MGGMHVLKSGRLAFSKRNQRSWLFSFRLLAAKLYLLILFFLIFIVVSFGVNNGLVPFAS